MELGLRLVLESGQRVHILILDGPRSSSCVLGVRWASVFLDRFTQVICLRICSALTSILITAYLRLRRQLAFDISMAATVVRVDEYFSADHIAKALANVCDVDVVTMRIKEKSESTTCPITFASIQKNAGMVADGSIYQLGYIKRWLDERMIDLH